jgi:hypothetical protein
LNNQITFSTFTSIAQQTAIAFAESKTEPHHTAKTVLELDSFNFFSHSLTSFVVGFGFISV